MVILLLNQAATIWIFRIDLPANVGQACSLLGALAPRAEARLKPTAG